jgi:hypothetical protein
MVIGFCAFCSAQTTQTSQKEVKTATVAVSEDDGYKEVKMEELNVAVQEAIKKNYAGLKISKLTYNAEKKLTKITFLTLTGEEKVVILDAEGKEYTE